VIVELRTYTIQPTKMKEWLDNYEQLGLPTQLRMLGKLIGFFTTEIGPLNQVTHLWAYDSLADREARRAAMMKDPEWERYRKSIPPIVLAQECKILNPTSFSPLK
jgi:hypothetical protein